MHIQFILNKAFKGAVVNRALSSLHGGSLEITLTVHLGNFFCLKVKSHLKVKYNILSITRSNLYLRI